MSLARDYCKVSKYPRLPDLSRDYSRRGALGAASSAWPPRLTCGGWKERRTVFRLLAVAWGAAQPVLLRPQPAAALGLG